MIRFQERTFGGRQFRPRPEVLLDADGGLLLITTPWGSRAQAEKVNALVRDQFFSARADLESTSPFDRLSCLTPTGNDLRVAVKLANDTVYQEDNRDEYTFGFEMLAIAIHATEITWTQIGYPNIFLDRPNSCLLPLSAANDLSTEFGHPQDLLSPLPNHVLGTDAHSDFQIRTIRPQAGERMLFISRAFLPQGVFELAYGARTIEQVSHVLSSDNETMPFWIGEMTLE